MSLFKLGSIYGVKSPKTRPHDRPSVCDVFSETKYLVSRSWCLVAYTWYLQIFVEEALFLKLLVDIYILLEGVSDFITINSTFIA